MTFHRASWVRARAVRVQSCGRTEANEEATDFDRGNSVRI